MRSASRLAVVEFRLGCNAGRGAFPREGVDVDTCLNIILACVVGGFLLIALFIVLLALPKSRLASSLQMLFGFGVSAVSTVLFISPIDFIPLPGVPIDDPFYVLGAIGGAVVGYLGLRERQRLSE